MTEDEEEQESRLLQPDPSLLVMEAKLRELIRGDSYSILVKYIESSISRVDIPFIRMLEMIED